MISIGAASPGSSSDEIPDIGKTILSSKLSRQWKRTQTASPPPGGCDFPADPAIPASQQPIYWTPQAAPAVIRLTTVAAELLASGSLGRGIFDAAALRQAADGLHAVWSLGPGEVQARLDEPASAEAFAVIIPVDAALELRALTVIRLWRLLNRLAPGPEPVPLSAARRARLVQMLRVLDARQEGASLRDVAETLFRQRVVGRAWQGSSLHARTKRLVQGGLAMAQGGYRDLLDPLSRRRKRRGYENPTP